MSDSTVKVNIIANSDSFAGPVGDATIQAQNFAKALQAAGGDLRKITPEMLGMGTATKTAAAALVSVATEAKTASINFQGIIDATNGVDRGFKSAADSASVFQRALDPSPLQQMKTLMGTDIPEAAGHAHTGMAGITRELIVMGHEAMQGRYSRIPGSMMVLAERSGSLTNAVAAMASGFTVMGGLAVGAILAAAAAFVTLIMRAHEANVAIHEAMNIASFQGRSPKEAAAEVTQYATALKATGYIGTTEATKIGSAIAQLSNVTAEQKAKIQALAPGLFINFKEDAAKTVEEIGKIFESDQSLKTYVEANHVLSVQQQTAWDSATTAAQRYQLGIDALSNRLNPMLAQYKAVNDQAKANRMLAMGGGEVGGIEAISNPEAANMSKPEGLGDFDPGTKAADPKQVSDRAATEEHTKDIREQAKLNEDLIKQQADLATATAAGDTAGATAARRGIDETKELIANFKLAGDASWAQKQTAALEDIKIKIEETGKTRKQVAEDTARAEVTFWNNAAAQEGISESQKRLAVANSAHARLALLKDELTGSTTTANEIFRAKLAALTEEEAANHDNFAKVMAIEDQKLALLKGAGLKYAAEYQTELAKRDNMQREYAAKQLSLAEADLSKQRAIDTQETAQKKSDLEEQVSDGNLTKQQEIAALRSFESDKHATELQGLTDLLATLGQESEAYKKLYSEIGLLKAQWVAQDKALNREAAADMKQQWDSATAPISNAFSTSMNGVIQGTNTVMGAVGKMAQSVILSYADMGVKAAVHWLSSTLMQTFATTSGEAAKTAAATSGTLTRQGLATSETAQANASILTRVSRYVFGETQKTVAASSGATQRAVVTNTEAATENTSLLGRIGRWIATQLGMTAATSTGATTRAADLTAEQLASSTAVATGARAMIGAAASVASAWAFADSAALGPVGLAAAPEAALAAYAVVMANQATVPGLAVGAWDLPKDMPANLHAGEMVIPANFASGIRGAMGGGGSGQTLNYSPTVNGGSSADTSAQMRQQSQQFKTYMWHATRNGALSMPGR